MFRVLLFVSTGAYSSSTEGIPPTLGRLLVIRNLHAHIHPAWRARHRLRFRSGTQRVPQPLNGVVQRVLHAATHSHVGYVFPGLALRGSGAMLGAEGRWIVDNMLEVSPGHIRHWEMQGKNEDTTEEVWEGREVHL